MKEERIKEILANTAPELKAEALDYFKGNKTLSELSDKALYLLIGLGTLQ